MAEPIPTSDGVASVSPASTPPDDYQKITANPEAFGGGLAQGLESLGAGTKKAADFYQHAVADDASNQFQDYATKLMHGDPNKPMTGPDGMPVMGPDGKPMPDTGYLGTRGRTAMDQRQSAEQALDAQEKQLRSNLGSPEAQLQFDNFVRRYRSQTAERIGGHADQQSTTWYTQVNTDSAKLALDHISNNADNPNEVKAGAADIIHAYTKNAQLNGAQPGDPQFQEAEVAGKRDALQAWLNAVAVKDPARAQAMLDKPENKAIAGATYDNLSTQYRSRAQQQQGFDIANQKLRETYQANPAPSGYQPAVLTQAGAPYGISGSYLQRTQMLETASNPNQTSETGAKGPFQFIDSTAKKYGLTDPFDYQKAADAAARLAADNKTELSQRIGRTPTDTELYLAHQQGASGAAVLLANPSARAGDLVGDRAIRVNGGDPNAPASQFTSMWAARFVGAPGQAASTRKAAAFQSALSDPSIPPEVLPHVLQHMNQQLQADQIAQEQDAKSMKAKNDAIASDISSRIIKGTAGPEIIGQIADSGLSAPEMQTLFNFATGNGGIQDDLHYGPGYAAAFKQITSSPDDPSHISAPIDIIARGGPGGDLTKKGVSELLSNMEKIKKQPDQAGVTTAKSHLLDYYLDKFAIDQNSPLAGIPGVKEQRDQKGKDRFNRDFVPAFEAAYSKWVGAGKDPMDFLTDRKKMDDIMNMVYPPSERAADAIKSQPKAPEKPPAAPDGASQGSWDHLMADPPKLRTGENLPIDKWGKVLTWIEQNPTPENKAAFDAKFGPSGYTSDMVLKRLPHEPAEQAASPAQPAPPASEEKHGGILSKLGEIREHNKQAIKELEAKDGSDAAKHADENLPESPELRKIIENSKMTPAEIEEQKKRTENTDQPTSQVGIRG